MGRVFISFFLFLAIFPAGIDAQTWDRSQPIFSVPGGTEGVRHSDGMIRNVVDYRVSLLRSAGIDAQTWDRSQPIFSVPGGAEGLRHSDGMIRNVVDYQVNLPRSSESLCRPENGYPLSFSETFLRFGNRGRDRIFTDFSNFYRQGNVKNYGFLLLGAATLANTNMDRRFQRWHQNQIQCNFTDEFSEFTKIFGEGKIFIPVTVTTTILYRFYEEKSGRFGEKHSAANFFDRTARGYAVGAPTLLIGQYVLGGDRPRLGTSYWHPFQHSHGISGHAFIGAVPFITAAQMTDRLWAKGLFYTLSIIPGWSRVNDDAHFLSQVILGWYLAYLSVRSVSETEGLKPLPRGLTIFPVVDGNAFGIGIVYRR